jgi:hypothetical protein
VLCPVLLPSDNCTDNCSWTADNSRCLSQGSVLPDLDPGFAILIWGGRGLSVNIFIHFHAQFVHASQLYNCTSDFNQIRLSCV